MTEETQKEQVHVCGQCAAEFPSEEAYCDHKCEATGFAPTEPEHQGEHFKKIQEAALARGEEKKVPETPEA